MSGKKRARDFTHLLPGTKNMHKSLKIMRHNTRSWGKEDEKSTKPREPKIKPNFGLSGALAKDSKTGNTKHGIILKWSEPLDAAIPNEHWRFYIFKNEKDLGTLHLHGQSAFLVGRERKIADILVEHGSCSKQHAVIQFRKRENRIRPYLMDLNSTNGTSLNGKQIEESRFVELREKDLVKFGESTREYVLMKVKY